MSEHEHDGIEHTHDDGRFYGTHEHDGIEHTHDESDISEETSDSVEPLVHGKDWDYKPVQPKRQVPVIIEGVNHGMRDAEEGE